MARNKGQSQGQSHGSASRTRLTKKRKLKHVHQVLPKQGGEESMQNDRQANIGFEPHDIQKIEKRSLYQKRVELLSTEQSKPWLPEKRVLELIIDTLQKRDIHDIFAEPVDPEKVEYYYEIIKNPMDFGTLRANLHRGIYTDLAHFENDVDFITKNAMYFNSSATIYYKEARAINQLAVKIFNVLKTNPENFEYEFLQSRKKYDLKDFSEGENYRRLLRSVEVDKRCMYKPRKLLLDEDDSFISTLSSNKKQLECIIQQEIGYSESLKLFVKDLGPIVQMIAKRKLLESLFRFKETSSRNIIKFTANQSGRTDLEDAKGVTWRNV